MCKQSLQRPGDKHVVTKYRNSSFFVWSLCDGQWNDSLCTSVIGNIAWKAKISRSRVGILDQILQPFVVAMTTSDRSCWRFADAQWCAAGALASLTSSVDCHQLWWRLLVVVGLHLFCAWRCCRLYHHCVRRCLLWRRCHNGLVARCFAPDVVCRCANRHHNNTKWA